VYKNGRFYLRNSNTTGTDDLLIQFGGGVSDLPVAGNWNGDSFDTVGVYHSNEGRFMLTDDSIFAATVTYDFAFGNPGDTPLAGRWSADMTADGVGVYRTSNGIAYFKKTLAAGFSDFYAVFGDPADQPVVGDWNNDGFDSIGIYRSSNTTWYLSNNNTPGGSIISDVSFDYTIGPNFPVAGDWDIDGTTTVGYYNPIGVFSLHSTNASSGSDLVFAYGPVSSAPITGKWPIAGSRPPPLVAAPGGNSINPVQNGGGD